MKVRENFVIYKMILKIILLLFVYIIIDFQVLAASLDNLSNLSLTNMDKNDSVCVFKTPVEKGININGISINSKEFDYIVIQFLQNTQMGTSAYEAVDYTFSYLTDDSGSELAYKTYLFANGENSSGRYLNSKNCDDYFAMFEEISGISPPSYNIYLYKKEYSSQFAKNVQYFYNIEATNKVKKNIVINNNESQINNCVFNVDDKEIQLGNYVSDKVIPSFNYFRSPNSEWYICPATLSGNTHTFERIKFNISNFKCENYKLVKNLNYVPSASNITDSKCYYYIVDKDLDTNQEEVEVETQGDYITKYVNYNNSKSSIRIIKSNEGTLKAMLDNQTIVISNLNEKNKNGVSYNNVIKTWVVDNYPRYLIEYIGDTGLYTYKFADYSDSKANANYINLNHVGDLFKTGSDINETCRDLLGDNFLKFLNNNVFKVIYIGVPILLIVLTTFDFAKVVFIDDKDGIGSAGKKFGKRVIAAFLIYLVPTILIFASNIFGSDEINKCAKTLKDLTETIDN